MYILVYSTLLETLKTDFLAAWPKLYQLNLPLLSIGPVYFRFKGYWVVFFTVIHF